MVGDTFGLASALESGRVAITATTAATTRATIMAPAAISTRGCRSQLGAMSLDFMARSFPGSQVSFEPIARLLGESAPGWLTRVAIGTGEGLAFGSGLAFGLTHRPR